MKLDREQVLHVADLARLELSEEEVDKYSSQLSSILDYVEQIGEVDLDAVEPMAHVLEVVTPLRSDEVRPSLPREKVLANAPAAEDGCFRVPKIIEG